MNRDADYKVKKLMIDGKLCWWTELKPTNTDRYNLPRRYCPFCGEEVYTLDRGILIGSNNVLFPNVFCHVECVPNGITEEVMLFVKKHYEESRDFLEEALAFGKPWFSYINL